MAEKREWITLTEPLVGGGESSSEPLGAGSRRSSQYAPPTSSASSSTGGFQFQSTAYKDAINWVRTCLGLNAGKAGDLESMETNRKRRFGVLFLFNVITVIFASVFTISRNVQFAQYITASDLAFKDILGMDPDVLDPNVRQFVDFYTMQDVLTHANQTLVRYFTYKDTALSHVVTSREVVVHIESSLPDWVNHTTILTPDTGIKPLEPSLTAFLEFVRNLISIEFVYHFSADQRHNRNVGVFVDVDVSWTSRCIYDFSLDADRARYYIKNSVRFDSFSNNILVSLNTVVLLMCLISCAITLTIFYRQIITFRRVRDVLDHPPDYEGQIVWDKLPLRDRFSFFNLWHLVTFLGDMFMLVASIQWYRQESGDLDYRNADFDEAAMVRSLGLFFLWIGLMKYFEYAQETHMLVLALKASSTRVLKYIIAVLPIFFGYVFSGVESFWPYGTLFDSTLHASQTLFAVMNGDSILLAFQTLTSRGDARHELFAQLYLYSFSILTICVVLNVFIFIIEAGVDLAHMHVYGDEDMVVPKLRTERLQIVLTAALEQSRGKSVPREEMQPSDDDAIHVRTRLDTMAARRATVSARRETVVSRPRSVIVTEGRARSASVELSEEPEPPRFAAGPSRQSVPVINIEVAADEDSSHARLLQGMDDDTMSVLSQGSFDRVAVPRRRKGGLTNEDANRLVGLQSDVRNLKKQQEVMNSKLDQILAILMESRA